MVTTPRGPASRVSRFMVTAAVALALGVALTSCGKAPELPKAPQSEAEAPEGVPERQPMAPGAGQEESQADARDDYGSSAGGAAPPKNGDTALPAPSANGAPSAAPPKKWAAKPYNYEAPKYEAPSDSIGSPIGGGPAPPPPLEMAPPAGAPGEGAGRGLGTVQPPPPPRPAAAAPSAPSSSPAAAGEAPKAYDVVPVFFGTDRVVEPDPTRLRYGPDRAHKLQLGRAMITVPTAHKVPNIERPWAVEIPYFKVKIYEEKEDLAKHFTVQEIAAMTPEQVLALVKARLDKSSTFKKHAIVFVHGFNTSFDNALYRTAQIAYDLKFDGAPFVYSWPSGGKVASYTYDRGSAEAAEPHLAEFLEFVVQKSGAKSISLIAHSMGNELLLRVLERARPIAPPGVVISQVILAAPDVDRDKFANIAKQITSFSKGVTLYAASNDRALGYSARFWGGIPRAGDVPATGPMIVPGVDTIDVTTVSTDGLGLNHSGYAENPELLNDVKALIRDGVRPPNKRIKNLLTVESAAGTFWRYPPQKPLPPAPPP
ncbi:MAG: alpha/beta hydrolase [Hyphomicrobium sp.]